jgi:hypothetical protein
MYYLTTSHGLRGWFAVLVDDSNGFPEPVQTGYGSYETAEEARKEAEEWAIAENLKVR